MKSNQNQKNVFTKFIPNAFSHVFPAHDENLQGAVCMKALRGNLPAAIPRIFKVLV